MVKIVYKLNKNKLIKIQFFGVNYFVSLQYKYEICVVNIIEILYKINCYVYNRFLMMFKYKKYILNIDVCLLVCNWILEKDMVLCC